MSPRKGHLIVVSGPSGVGKTTLIERALKEEARLLFSVSYTTRAKRQNEVDGRDYYFTDEATFQRMIDNNGFLEWEPVHGYLYGTPIKEISESDRRGARRPPRYRRKRRPESKREVSVSMPDIPGAALGRRAEKTPFSQRRKRD